MNKQRHGCLTAWLIFMIVANAGTALLYLLGRDMLNRAAAAGGTPVVPEWAAIVLSLGVIINLACAIALFMWKKWAFYGFAVTTVLALGVNLSVGLGISRSLIGLVGIAVLYGVLQIGEQKKGWDQLE